MEDSTKIVESEGLKTESDSKKGENEQISLEIAASAIDEFIPWKLARELGKDSYQMALRREQIIDDKFGRLITFITVIIATVAFVITNFGNENVLNQKFVLYFLMRFEIQWKSVLALVMALLFAILFISILGQYGYKKDYLQTSMNLLNEFEKKKDEYNNVNSVNYVFVDQYEKVHTALNKVLDRKTFLLNVSHILMLIVNVLVMLIFLGIILK